MSGSCVRGILSGSCERLIMSDSCVRGIMSWVVVRTSQSKGLKQCKNQYAVLKLSAWIYMLRSSRG